MQVDSDDLEMWARLPATQWLLWALNERYPADVHTFAVSPDWDTTMRLKGRVEIMQLIENPLELWRLTNVSS